MANPALSKSERSTGHLDMSPKRVAVKLFASPDPATPVEVAPFGPLFHTFIQNRSVEGLLIDVADYAHVSDGPGVMLIGHDVDYSIDQAAGLAGLRTLGKHLDGVAFDDALRETIRKAVDCVIAIETDGRTGLCFDASPVEIQLVDRLQAPNTPEAFGLARAAAEPVLEELLGDTCVEYVSGGDPRRMLTLRATARQATDTATLRERLA